MSEPNSDKNHEERLLRIESALAHLQHDVDQLNESLALSFRQLQGFDDRFTQIEHEIESLNENPEVRDPGAERPPHY